jgi:hypothetical protein
LKDLSAEIAARNRSPSVEPIVLQYEHKSVCNVTFIDTPGLLDEDDSDVSKEERDSLVFNLAKPNHRIIICVEATRDWSRMEMVNFVKKVDPELSRTTFVYTKFQTHLQTFTSTREVNKFLSGTLPDVKTFFTTLPIEGVRAKFSEPDKFQQKIWQVASCGIGTAHDNIGVSKGHERFGTAPIRQTVLFAIRLDFDSIFFQI